MSHQTNRRQITCPATCSTTSSLPTTKTTTTNSIVTRATPMTEAYAKQELLELMRREDLGNKGQFAHVFCDSTRQLRLIVSCTHTDCCDCGAPNPQWASLSYAIFVCLTCAGVVCLPPIFPSMAPLIQNHTAISIEDSPSSGPLQWTRGRKTNFGK